jgi:hypothetical protein
MRNAYITRARALLFPAGVRADSEEDRSGYERCAIPHTFKPQLSFLEAVVATIGAFLRVLLGCLVFAVWGTYSLFAWSMIRNPFWRVGVQLPLFLSFIVSFVLIMLAIAALVRAASRGLRSRV